MNKIEMVLTKTYIYKKKFMQLGICIQNYIPMRTEPSEKAEMVSQVLYGEVFEVLEKNKSQNFSLIKTLHDDYQGWVDHKTIVDLEIETFDRMEKTTEFVTENIFSTLYLNSGAELRVGAGSSLWTKNKHITYPEHVLSIDNGLTIPKKSSRDRIKENAPKWIEIPYLWGGRSVFGTDCSGFTQNIFKQVGIRLPRDARDQALTGTTINFHSETRTGDIAFFDNSEGEITHVGILLGDGKIIHSSGKVRIDHFDHQGIFSEELARYTHNLRILKNVIDPN